MAPVRSSVVTLVRAVPDPAEPQSTIDPVADVRSLTCFSGPTGLREITVEHHRHLGGDVVRPGAAR